jgi:TetR/AcrR family transcriptional regulator, cholesterol catabolism regulator
MNTIDEKYINIIQESGRLFLKFGIRSLSMDDISRELGISKKTLYQYFENKADLIARILDFHLEQSRDRIGDHTQEKDNAIDVLLNISKVTCMHMKDFSPSAIFELQKYYPEIFKRFMDAKHEDIFKGISENLKQGIAEGLYREDIDIALIAGIYVQHLGDIFNPDFPGTAEYSLSKLFEAKYESHLRSIVNAKGLKYFEKRKKELDFNIDNLAL